MPLRERPTRAGLQVALESTSDGFVLAFDRDNKTPRAVTSGVAVRTIVVPPEALRHI
jgi:hypothetical protein